MSTSIKVSKENYERLCKISGKLQEELKKPVSLNQAITYLYNKTMIQDIAGTWSMTDQEEQDFKEELTRGWKQWNNKRS